MGSLVGIYESVIDGMSTRMSDNVPIRSKIVASTATVRRARSQIGALFDRGTSIFPALGLDAADSFFAKEEVEKTGPSLRWHLWAWQIYQNNVGPNLQCLAQPGVV